MFNLKKVNLKSLHKKRKSMVAFKIIQIIPSINCAIDIFDWGNSFKGKNVHEQVHFFNKTILNIFHNYIPNKTILCNDKDPPWFNNEIRKILTKKNEIFKQYIANRKSVAIDQ